MYVQLNNRLRKCLLTYFFIEMCIFLVSSPLEGRLFSLVGEAETNILYLVSDV